MITEQPNLFRYVMQSIEFPWTFIDVNKIVC